jgi:hypothetical protein
MLKNSEKIYVGNDILYTLSMHSIESGFGAYGHQCSHHF